MQVVEVEAFIIRELQHLGEAQVVGAMVTQAVEVLILLQVVLILVAAVGVQDGFLVQLLLGLMAVAG